MAGMASKFSKWTPMDSPIKYAMTRIHRRCPGSSATFSHFKMAQNTSAVNNEDNAYTSPSTAENQKLSLNVYANAPTAPAPMTAQRSAVLASPEGSAIIFFAKCVMLQKRNKMVNELLRAESELAKTAAVSGVAKIIKKRARSMKKGAPGGWPTSSLNAEAMNSPQSQKLAVGSMVDR